MPPTGYVWSRCKMAMAFSLAVALLATVVVTVAVIMAGFGRGSTELVLPLIFLTFVWGMVMGVWTQVLFLNSTYDFKKI